LANAHAAYGIQPLNQIQQNAPRAASGGGR